MPEIYPFVSLQYEPRTGEENGFFLWDCNGKKRQLPCLKQHYAKPHAQTME